MTTDAGPAISAEMTLDETTSTPSDSHSAASSTCGRCETRRRSRELIDEECFDAAIQSLTREVNSLDIDVNGNLRRTPALPKNEDSSESLITCEACRSIPSRNVIAETWCLLSRALLERAVAADKSIERAWEDVPKRHKKKASNFAELFKTLKKVPADLKTFYEAWFAYDADVKGSVAAADEALALDSTFHEAHFHKARAVYKSENHFPVDEKKTISAIQHITKYLRLEFGEEAPPPGFHPMFWLFLKELNHGLYQSTIFDSPAFDSIHNFEEVFLVGKEGPSCFKDIKAASKYIVRNEILSATFLVSPGHYDATLEDVAEFPEGTRLCIVGNVSSKTALRWRQVMRHLSESVVITLPSEEAASPFSVSGNVALSFARIAFVTSGDNAASVISATEGAVVEVDGCSFHGTLECDEEVAVGISATSDGIISVSSSLFFHLANGVIVEDGGKATLMTTSFFDVSVGLVASSQANVETDTCEFVNSEVVIHGNAEGRLFKSSFKRQQLPSLTSSTCTGLRDLVKIRKGASVSVVGCRFSAVRHGGEGCEDAFAPLTSAVLSVGGFGSKVFMIDNSFAHVDKCVLLTDKAKGEIKRSKFLDCGRMLLVAGHAKAVLEENTPCAGMIPLTLDEDAELPEMRGPNTYRAERPSNAASTTLSSPGMQSGRRMECRETSPSRQKPTVTGRQFCHHCLKDDVCKDKPSPSVHKAASSKMSESSPETRGAGAISPTTPKDGHGKKKKKKPKADASPTIASTTRRQSVVAESPKESLSSTSLSTPSPRESSSPRMGSPTAFLFCACGSSYCSRDCQKEDWKDHQLVCGVKRKTKGRKTSLNGL